MATQKQDDDDVRYRNRFRDGGNDEPMQRQTKRVFNKATGRHETSKAKKVHPGGAVGWYKEKAGMGTGKKGTGALAKRRKASLDHRIQQNTGE